MAYLLTAIIFAFLAVFVVLMLRAATKRAAARREEESRVRVRAEKEEELLERVARVRKKRQEAIGNAIRDDPRRAAGAVRAMMREGKGTGRGGKGT